jgi:hypothetical protein
MKRYIADFLQRRVYDLLKKSSWLQYVFDESLSSLRIEKRLSSAGPRFELLRFKGPWIESSEVEPENENETVQRVISSFNAAQRALNNVSSPYLPSGRWKGFLRNRLGNFYDFMERNDRTEAFRYFRNFFRNASISGLWCGDVNVFEVFCHDRAAQLSRERLMKEQYIIWRTALPEVSSAELDAPRVGNPWGFRLGEYLLYEPVFIDNFQAHFFSGLLRGLSHPVVLEIGGGFGGLAHHLMRSCPNSKYIGYDLPENIALQTYYLCSIFPKARVLTYQENIPSLTVDVLDDFDFVLLPNFELTRAGSLIADLIVSVRVLSSISPEAITEYFSQIDRIGRVFFYHESLYGKRKDHMYGVSSYCFPFLKNFVQLSSTESIWPMYKAEMNYPCRENLFIRRSLVSDSVLRGKHS